MRKTSVVLRETVGTPLAALDPTWATLMRKLAAHQAYARMLQAIEAFGGDIDDPVGPGDELSFAEMFELATLASVSRDPLPREGTYGPTRAIGRQK